MKKNFKFIVMLALPYVLSVLLPILSVLGLVSMLMNNHHEKIINDKERNIEIAFERFLQRIDNVETVAYTIARSNDMTEYVHAGFQSRKHTILDNLEVGELLKNFAMNNDVGMLFFYYSPDNRIITGDTVLSDATQFFKYTYQLEGYTPEKCVERLKHFVGGYEISPAMNAQINNVFTKVIEYRVSVPISQFNELQSQVVLVMEVDDIFCDFYDIMDEGSEFYVYHKEELIFGSGNQYKDLLDVVNVSELKQIHKGDMEGYGMVCQSDDKVWSVKVCTSDLLRGSNLVSSTLSVWMLTGIPLAASILCCIYFTYRNHREIQEILMLFKGQKKASGKREGGWDGGGYKVIRQYADQLINENMKFKEKLPELQYLRKYEILDKLIRKTYNNEEEIVNALHDEELHIQNGKCIVICIRYKGSGYRTFVSDNMTVKDFVKWKLSEIIEGEYEIFDTYSRETICILSIDDGYIVELAQDIIARLNVDVVYHYQTDVEIGVGGIVESIFYLNDSYRQAREVIRYKETSGKQVYLYSELEQLEDVYYFPREYDEKIYNYIVVGRKQEAKDIINKIYKENFEDSSRMLSVSAIQAVKNRIRESLKSVVDKYGIPEKGMLNELSNQTSIKLFFDNAYKAVDLLADKIVNKKRVAQQNTATKIMEYVNQNYNDNMLSVKHISQVFGIHENHVSRLFRSEYGENLSAVIERRRIEKACELIKNTDMKIGEIAETVGYSTDISFRRVFKRVTGMSPGEYRGE